MRLTTVILIASLMQVSATTFGQRITMSQKDAPLKTVLRELTKQSGYGFFYDGKAIGDDQKVTVALSNAEFDVALKSVLTGLNLSYKIDGKIVSIRKIEEPSLLDHIIARFQAIDVSGRVVDADGRALPGASVSVKGKGGKAVSTGTNGSFYLKGVDEDAVLVVSFIGYVTKEIKAAKELGDVVLELSTSKLDEVQVIAYGTTTQRLSTGNVTTIKADVIEKQPVNNPLLALQGRVPGLFIEQGNGFAGTAIKVRIQGQNSISNGNDPLYVIDGIPFTSQSLPGGNRILGGEVINIKGSYVTQAGNPLNFINPLDIESIDILKDADATAIYGSRAANGAILITTKKGQTGDIKVNANLQNGWGQVSRRLDLMNTQEYLQMRDEALKNDGIASPLQGPFGDSDLNGNWDNKRFTDWQKELIGNSSQFTDIQSSISGGSNNMTFFAGAGYHKEGNVFAGNFSDIKKNVHLNINSTSTNQKFRMQLSGSYLEDNNTLPKIDLTAQAMTLAPVAPKLFNDNGSLNWQPSDGSTTFGNNPMSFLYTKFNSKTNNLLANASLNYLIIPGLEVKSGFGYNKLQSNSIDYSSTESFRPEFRQFFVRNSNFSNSLINSWSIEPQITYKTDIGNGYLDVLVGSTIQQESRNASSINASGFSTDQVMEDIKSSTTLTAGYSINSIYKYNAIFGRINYNWKDKYILNLTARRDGSSRFGRENQFHNFGAIGSAWIFSQESVITDNLKFLSFGKIRASYGITGSDQISDYRFLSLYDVIPFIKAPYQGALGYQPTNLTNPYLQWEETKKLQIGLDLGFLKDRILFNSNYSLNRSSNQLLLNRLPFVTGFNVIASNSPATVQNTGWEFTLSTVNLHGEDFKWSSSINLTIPRNKILAVKDYENSVLKGVYDIGEPINRVKLYHYLGVDVATGAFQYQSLNGNPVTTPVGEDAYIVLSTDPRYYGGFQNSFEYLGFQLDILFQFTKQIGQNYLFGNSTPAGNFNYGLSNGPVSLLNRWQKPGDIATTQRYTTSYSNSNIGDSDASWSDASYVRLKNVSLSWQLPMNLKKKLRFENFKLYLQGQNLFTITNYYGLDPESKSSISLPPLRVITMGVQIGI